MNPCSKCGTENPFGSKFCAGCGTKLPRTEECGSCGVESPEGSRFCKGCGKPLGPSPASTYQRTTVPTAAAIPPKVRAESHNIQRVKAMLAAGVGLYSIGVFLMYSQISALQSVYGAYAGLVANTDIQWLLIVVDLACAALGLYAITQVNKGQYKLAKTMLIIMVVVGAIFLLEGLSGPFVYSLLNAALLAAGIWGWRLLSREGRGAI